MTVDVTYPTKPPASRSVIGKITGCLSIAALFIGIGVGGYLLWNKFGRDNITNAGNSDDSDAVQLSATSQVSNPQTGANPKMTNQTAQNCLLDLKTLTKDLKGDYSVELRTPDHELWKKLENQYPVLGQTKKLDEHFLPEADWTLLQKLELASSTIPDLKEYLPNMPDLKAHKSRLDNLLTDIIKNPFKYTDPRENEKCFLDGKSVKLTMKKNSGCVLAVPKIEPKDTDLTFTVKGESNFWMWYAAFQNPVVVSPNYDGNWQIVVQGGKLSPMVGGRNSRPSDTMITSDPTDAVILATHFPPSRIMTLDSGQFEIIPDYSVECLKLLPRDVSMSFTGPRAENYFGFNWMNFSGVDMLTKKFITPKEQQEYECLIEGDSNIKWFSDNIADCQVEKSPDLMKFKRLTFKLTEAERRACSSVDPPCDLYFTTKESRRLVSKLFLTTKDIELTDTWQDWFVMRPLAKAYSGRSPWISYDTKDVPIAWYRRLSAPTIQDRVIALMKVGLGEAIELNTHSIDHCISNFDATTGEPAHQPQRLFNPNNHDMIFAKPQITQNLQQVQSVDAVKVDELHGFVQFAPWQGVVNSQEFMAHRSKAVLASKSPVEGG